MKVNWSAVGKAFGYMLGGYGVGRAAEWGVKKTKKWLKGRGQKAEKTTRQRNKRRRTTKKKAA